MKNMKKTLLSLWVGLLFLAVMALPGITARADDESPAIHCSTTAEENIGRKHRQCGGYFRCSDFDVGGDICILYRWHYL